MHQQVIILLDMMQLQAVLFSIFKTINFIISHYALVNNLT